MCSLTTPARWLVVVVLVAASCGGQVDAANATHDLRIRFKPQVRMLIDAELVITGTLKVSGSGDERSLPLRQKRVVRCVDWFTRISDSGDEMRRRYLRCDETENRKIVDPTLAGFTIELEKKNGKVFLGPEEDRLISKAARNTLFSRGLSIGGWLPLPEAVGIGQPFTIEFGALAPMLLDLDDWAEEATAELELKEVDAEKKRATLVGSARALAKEGDDRGSLTTEFAGPLRIVLDRETSLISRLQWSGEAKGSGVMREQPVRLVASFKAELAVKTGAKARSAARGKGSFRNTERRVDDYKLAAGIPSHYIDVGESEKANVGRVFDSYLEGEEGVRRITVWSAPGADPARAVKGAAKHLRKAAVAFRPRTSSTGTKLGKGAVVSWKSEGRYAETVFMAGGGRLVRVSLYCPAKRKAAGKRDLKAALGSIRVLP